MTPWTLALLLILLPPPPEDEPTVVAEPSCPVAYQALKDAASLLGLYAREAHWGEYSVDLRWCQRAIRRSWGCPPASDVHRLPPLDLCRDRLQFADEHLEWLSLQQVVYPWRDLDGWRHDAQYCRWVWRLLLRAQSSDKDLASRRQALGDLRELIGERRYYAGEFWPWVPLWWFREAR